MRAAAATNKVNPIFLLRGQRTPLDGCTVARAACLPAIMQMLHAVAAAAFQVCLDACGAAARKHAFGLMRSHADRHLQTYLPPTYNSNRR
jgi:hypothetical protein